MSYRDPGPAITLPARGDPARRDPVRLLLSGAPWQAARFLAGYVLISGFLMAIALAAASTGVLLAVTLAGVPVVIAASGALRFAAGTERARLRPVLAAPLHGGYRRPARPGSSPTPGPAGRTRPPGGTWPTCSGCGSRCSHWTSPCW